MFTAVGVCVRQLFAMITVLFSAGEKTATAIQHLAIWGEETAGAFADQARIDRTANRLALEDAARTKAKSYATSPVVEDIAVKAKKVAAVPAAA